MAYMLTGKGEASGMMRMRMRVAMRVNDAGWIMACMMEISTVKLKLY